MSTPSVDGLVDLMPPAEEAGDDVAWDEVGLSLPADYRAFIAAYGGGTINGELNVLLPVAPADFPQWDPGSIAVETVNLRRLWGEAGGLDGYGPESVLAWGVGSANPDLFGWLTVGADPDAWPVVVARRHFSATEGPLARFDCGMAEFIGRTLRGEWAACPMSDLALWGRDGVFVHWREQQVRFQAGLDPMTGEPDPYAGMFG